MAHSYGLVPFRRNSGQLEVLIGHLGGPFWSHKNERAWSFPKGLPHAGETGLQTARREFSEELGIEAPTEGFIELGHITQSGGKRVTAWAVETQLSLNDFDPGTFTTQWPPRSGQVQTFPEIDKIAWTPVAEAASLLIAAQVEFLQRLAELVD